MKLNGNKNWFGEKFIVLLYESNLLNYSFYIDYEIEGYWFFCCKIFLEFFGDNLFDWG